MKTDLVAWGSGACHQVEAISEGVPGGGRPGRQTGIGKRLYLLEKELAADGGSRRGDVAGNIAHSDRGSQFRSWEALTVLARSMGRVGAADDNVAMESFFRLLQKNLPNRHALATPDELRMTIVVEIERTYHRRRRSTCHQILHQTLGQTPDPRPRVRGCF